jgi:predicted AAA+ superfamily ATPase
MQVYYWNESNAEVDFVLKWNNKVIGLEVKSTRAKVTGLHKFAQQFRPHKVYQLEDRQLPWQRFITMNPRELF